MEEGIRTFHIDLGNEKSELLTYPNSLMLYNAIMIFNLKVNEEHDQNELL